MHWCLHLSIYQVYFLFGDIYIRVRFTAVYTCMCDYNGVCMYMCMVITYSKGKDQPGKVANPARGQLAKQGNLIIPCPRSPLRIWSRETGSAIPSRVSLLISILKLNLVLTLRDSSRGPRRRPFIIGTHYAL